MRGVVKPYTREGKDAEGKPISLPTFDHPDPGKLLQQDFERSGGAAVLKAAAAAGKINDPEFIQTFEEEFGVDSLPFFKKKIRTMSHGR